MFRKTGVWFIEVKLTTISYIGTFLNLFKVWRIQDSGVSRVWFIQNSCLFRDLVYTGFWFIQGFGLYRILVYSGFCLYRVPVYSGFGLVKFHYIIS